MRISRLMTLLILILGFSFVSLDVICFAETVKQEQQLEIENNVSTFNSIKAMNTTISADSPDLWIPLGADGDVINTIYLEEGNVRISGRPVTVEEFILSSSFMGNRVTETLDNVERRHSILIQERANQNNLAEIQGFNRLNYGNSLVFESKGKILCAFTHNIRTYTRKEIYTDIQISANNANGSRTDLINSEFQGKEYFKVDVFESNSNFSHPKKSVVAKGDDVKSDVLDKWGSFEVEVGDVVRTWCAEPASNQFYVSNKEDTQISNHANEEGYAYYQVTEEGFEPVEGVVEKKVVVELKENILPVGTPSDAIDANDYIKSVTVNGNPLMPRDYESSIHSNINTNLVSTQETIIKVNVENQEIFSESKTKIIWKNSLVSMSGKANEVDSSVSLLDKNNKPYMVANEGTGLRDYHQLNSRTTMNFYRTEDDVSRHTITYETAHQTPHSLMDKWNSDLLDLDLEYGDVMTSTIFLFSPATENASGKNTWVSRDEQLVKETEGYDVAYYELTQDGYRLMHLNQIEKNSVVPKVEFGETLEEMNKKAAEAIIIPKHITNPEDYSFEYVSVDTTTSGKKTTKMNVYEKLSTNGKGFKTTLEVEYIVKEPKNFQIVEEFIDMSGKELQKSRITNHEVGKEYQPQSNNFIEKNGDLYTYVGWSYQKDVSNKEELSQTNPNKETKATTIYYYYERADTYINVTIPTEMIFGTEVNGKDITSQGYEIKNNSSQATTEVSLTQFNKKESEVALLSQDMADAQFGEKAARLHLNIDGNTVVNSLSDNTNSERIITLNPKEDVNVDISGTYFGGKSQQAKVNYDMLLKFKAVESK